MNVIADLINLYYKVEGDYDAFKGFAKELNGYDVDGISDEISSQAEMLEVRRDITLEEILSDDKLMDNVKCEIEDNVREWAGV